MSHFIVDLYSSLSNSLEATQNKPGGSRNETYVL